MKEAGIKKYYRAINVNITLVNLPYCTHRFVISLTSIQSTLIDQVKLTRHVRSCSLESIGDNPSIFPSFREEDVINHMETLSVGPSENYIVEEATVRHYH